jgi:hypothetical protein
MRVIVMDDASSRQLNVPIRRIASGYRGFKNPLKTIAYDQ